MPPGGIEELKKHPWFQDFDWEALAQRKVLAPMSAFQGKLA